MCKYNILAVLNKDGIRNKIHSLLEQKEQVNWVTGHDRMLSLLQKSYLKKYDRHAYHQDLMTIPTYKTGTSKEGFGCFFKCSNQITSKF